MCTANIPKTIAHRFWDYGVAQGAWDFSTGIVNNPRSGQKKPWKPRDGQHGIFEKKIPKALNTLSSIWLLLRRITTWAIWVERNDLTFNNNRWDSTKLNK
jgi:hypothetical protein